MAAITWWNIYYDFFYCFNDTVYYFDTYTYTHAFMHVFLCEQKPRPSPSPCMTGTRWGFEKFSLKLVSRLRGGGVGSGIYDTCLIMPQKSFRMRSTAVGGN